MKINRHFAPKDKSNLHHYFTSNHHRHNSTIDDTTNNYNQQQQQQFNENKLNSTDVNEAANTFLRERQFDKPSNNSNYNSSRQEYSGRLTERRTKIQNFKDSLQNLQKIISKSKQVLNQTSFINQKISNLKPSPKKAIKSDSLDIKFRYSTKNMNQNSFKQNKLKNVTNMTHNHQQTHNRKDYRQNLLLQSINRNAQNQQNKSHTKNHKYLLNHQITFKKCRPQALRQINDHNNSNAVSNLQTPRQNQPLSNTWRNIPLPPKQKKPKQDQSSFNNHNQISTNQQLNSTLQRLLNLTVQNSVNAQILDLNTPSTNWTGQSPKWFKSSQYKLLNKWKQKENQKLTKNRFLEGLKINQAQTQKNLSFQLNRSNNNRSKSRGEQYQDNNFSRQEEKSQQKQYLKIKQKQYRSKHNKTNKQREYRNTRSIFPHIKFENLLRFQQEDQSFEQQIQEMNRNHKHNIFIDDRTPSVFENQQPENINEIQNQEQLLPLHIQQFIAKNRNKYKDNLKVNDMHQSYLRSFTHRQKTQQIQTSKSRLHDDQTENYIRKQNLYKPQLNNKTMVIKTPKVYFKHQTKNKQTSFSKQKKSWRPKNFQVFQQKVLNGHFNNNVFKQSTQRAKFSPRKIKLDKQNRIKEQLRNYKKQYLNNKNQMAKDFIDQKSNKSFALQNQKKRQFINQIWKHPFAQRYLKQSQLVQIYCKLKKSKIPQHKWILFVIDQVHRKMKKLPNKLY